MICPKCQFSATDHDADMLPGVCPACGIAYAKWRGETSNGASSTSQEEIIETGVSAELKAGPWRERLYYYLCFMPSDRDEASFWGHGLLLVAFFFWGWSFILGGIDWFTINNSFLHLPNLAFHEYGHIMFSPFGRFMAILGGSLLQILVPLGIMAIFIVKTRDNFAASIMLWWVGQNFIDVSPYIADAVDRSMPLIGGLGVESHDWGNLLRMTGLLDYSSLLAGLCFGIGAGLIIASNVWGGHLLYIEFCGRTRHDEDDEWEETQEDVRE